MTIEQKIKMALSYTGISQSELARKIGRKKWNRSLLCWADRGGLNLCSLTAQ